MSTQENSLTHRQIMVIFSGLMMTMLLPVLDQTIVATALPTIASDLGGDAHISWVATAYLLTTTITAPLYGKISDLIGRKTVYQLAIVIFLIGSIFSGLAHTMNELIAYRAVQGLGAGGLMSLSFAIVGDVVSPRDRGKYQGYFSTTTLLGTVLGPLLGGLFTEDLSWRWIFYINVPLGAGALVVTALKLNLPRRVRKHSFDVSGSVLMAFTVSALLVAVSTGGNTFAWGSPTVIGLFIATVVGIVALCRREAHAKEPLFPPRVFLHPVTAASAALTLLLTAAQFAGVIYLPIYLQLAKGISPLVSGLSMLPLVFASSFSSIFSGHMISKYGRYKVFPIFASIMMLIGMALFTTMDSGTSHLLIALYMVVFGLGMGSGLQVLVTVMQNAVEARDIGVASSSQSFFRNIGASLGTALFGAVLVARLDHWLPRLLPGRHLNAATASAMSDPENLRKLSPTLRIGITDSFVNSLHSVFLAGIPMLVIALIVAIALKEIPLGSKSAIDRTVAE
jgi:EmrB/QacA subfamily drug resistance transporter